MIELRAYVDETGRAPFARWLASLDRTAASRVTVALGRLEDGNTGAIKSVGDGVHELKISFDRATASISGVGETLVILLWGGTKQRQSHDIARAKTLWRAYQAEQKRKD